MLRPLTVLAAAVVAAAVISSAGPAAASAALGPPGGIIGPPPGPNKPLPVPYQPLARPLVGAPLAVTIPWRDDSTNEQKFVLYKRDVHGAWQEIYEVPTRDMPGITGEYEFVDTDQSVSGQCYMIAAVGLGGTGSTPEECTVRPDPSRFPQSPPKPTQQWWGLSGLNDGPGHLHSDARGSDSAELTNADQRWGVGLDWTKSPALWKAEARGGPHLMHGQAVALRVWGGGWLRYAREDHGIDLELSDTPSYEWYALDGNPGTPIGSHFALWNSAAEDYLVADDNHLGVSLNWYRKTLPDTPPSTPPVPPQGVKILALYNCIQEERPLEMWVSDLSAGGGWADEGQLDSQWSGGGCPQTGQPWAFTPPSSGHTYQVRAVDYGSPGCDDDPTRGDCWRFDWSFVGDTSGQVMVKQLG